MSVPQIAPGRTSWLLLDRPAQVHHGVDGRKRSPDIDTQGTGLSLQAVILPSSTRLPERASISHCAGMTATGPGAIGK